MDWSADGEEKKIPHKDAQFHRWVEGSTDGEKQRKCPQKEGKFPQQRWVDPLAHESEPTDT